MTEERQVERHTCPICFKVFRGFLEESERPKRCEHCNYQGEKWLTL